MNIKVRIILIFIVIVVSFLNKIKAIGEKCLQHWRFCFENSKCLHSVSKKKSRSGSILL